jgi:hypothetical protein
MIMMIYSAFYHSPGECIPPKLPSHTPLQGKGETCDSSRVWFPDEPCPVSAVYLSACLQLTQLCSEETLNLPCPAGSLIALRLDHHCECCPFEGFRHSNAEQPQSGTNAEQPQSGTRVPEFSQGR